jgi:hypothetical protein
MSRNVWNKVCGLSCVFALFTLSCHHDHHHSSRRFHVPIVGSGRIVSESLSLPPFQSVDTWIGEAEIVITQAGTQSVRIETDDNIIDEILISVSGGVLIIDTDANYDTDYGVRIFLDMTEVQVLRQRGVGSISATNISSSGNLRVVLTGVGSITLSGSVDTYEARLDGVGGIDAENLGTRLSTIDIGGTGDCRITVSEELNGTISGFGNIYYAGNPPIVNENITGTGALIPI